MRAYWIETTDGQTRLSERETPLPEAGSGQMLLRVHAAALNRGEFIAGHGLTSKPARAGIEGAGEVVTLGEGVSNFKLGDRIMGRLNGAYAEYATIDAREAIPVPSTMDWQHAAATPITFAVVHDMLIGQGRMRPGEWVLVPGVTSGVGVAGLQAAKALGARVIGLSRSAAKLESLTSLGLDVALVSHGPDFHDAVMRATDNHGADLTLNTVGGSIFAECVRAAAFQGRIAMVGYLDRCLDAQIDLAKLHAQRLRIYGVSNKHRDAAARAETIRGFIRDLLPAFADGRISPRVDREFPFDQLPDAKRYMESDAQTGKIVIRIG